MSQLKEISEKQMQILKELNILAIYLIGSRAVGNFRDNSDFDFAILFDTQKTQKKQDNEIYNAIYDILESILVTTNCKKPVNIDIIFLHKSPLYYFMHAIKEGKMVYDENVEKRKEIEEMVVLQYADFEPLRKEQEEAILSFV